MLYDFLKMFIFYLLQVLDVKLLQGQFCEDCFWALQKSVIIKTSIRAVSSFFSVVFM